MKTQKGLIDHVTHCDNKEAKKFVAELIKQGWVELNTITDEVKWTEKGKRGCHYLGLDIND